MVRMDYQQKKTYIGLKHKHLPVKYVILSYFQLTNKVMSILLHHVYLLKHQFN